MGTFHHDKGDLHGITVVVDTNGPVVVVGRCDTITPEGVILLDAAVHEEDGDGPSKSEYLEKAARFGIWKTHDRLIVPNEDVASIRKLGDLA